MSNVTGEGLDALAEYLVVGRTVALLGSSGVGKSTLINRLLGRELLPTAEVSAGGRGRHTTTRREVVLLPGGGLLRTLAVRQDARLRSEQRKTWRRLERSRRRESY